jgi:hypothetical protein
VINPPTKVLARMALATSLVARRAPLVRDELVVEAQPNVVVATVMSTVLA